MWPGRRRRRQHLARLGDGSRAREQRDRIEVALDRDVVADTLHVFASRRANRSRSLVPVSRSTQQTLGAVLNDDRRRVSRARSGA